VPIKVVPSSERAGFGTEGLPEAVYPGDAHKEAADALHERLGTVLSYGCLTCTTKNVETPYAAPPTKMDGSRRQCPYLVREDLELTHTQLELAKSCPVPELYALVYDGVVTKVTGEDVQRLIPEFGDPDHPDEEPAHGGEALGSVFPEVTQGRRKAERAEVKRDVREALAHPETEETS
jgi:hypothetical protein